MLIALPVVLGVDLIVVAALAAFVLGRRRWLKRQPGEFAVPGDREPPVHLEQPVKTEAVSIYRKLTDSSRSEAIERAIEVGLIESSILPPPANLIQKG